MDARIPIGLRSLDHPECDDHDRFSGEGWNQENLLPGVGRVIPDLGFHPPESRKTQE